MLAQEGGGGGEACKREVENLVARIEGENLQSTTVAGVHVEGGKGEAAGDSLQTLEANECSTLPATHTPSLEGQSPPSAPALTPADMARVRAQVASVVALGNQSWVRVSSACSSYFIEPVEWMGDLLLGEVEGKVSLKEMA